MGRGVWIRSLLGRPRTSGAQPHRPPGRSHPDRRVPPQSAEGIVLRPKPEEIPAERHSSGWIVFQSGEQERIDPVESVEEQRERRRRQVRGDA